jgi:hypothetical protein
MEAKTCPTCGEAKPRSEWYPSTWDKAGQWCRSCYQDWHRQRYTPKNAADDTPRDCQVCGVSYQPKNRRPSTFCSRTCKDRHKNLVLAAERLASKPAERFCLHCAVAFPASKRADAIFCSADCNLAAHRLNRSLRRRTGEGLTGWLRASIFERDGWVCGICHKAVEQSLRFPDPAAPSLDHVVPVCEGGLNDPGNLRLTHLRCNVSRRHRGGNEQLALM